LQHFTFDDLTPGSDTNQLMLRLLRLFLGLLFRCFCSRRVLLLENLALRQQLLVFKQRKQRPMLAPFDKLFWIGIKTVWSQSKNSLVFWSPPKPSCVGTGQDFGDIGVGVLAGLAESLSTKKYATSLFEWCRRTPRGVRHAFTVSC